jgi:hypothetical protein
MAEAPDFRKKAKIAIAALLVVVMAAPAVAHVTARADDPEAGAAA